MSALIPRDVILEMLVDDKWHPLREFLRLGLGIPPELACRQYIKMFKRDDNLPEIDLDKQISIGRRRAVVERLRDLTRRGRLIVRGRGPKREYRRAPKC